MNDDARSSATLRHDAWSPEVREGLQAMIEAHPGGVAAFDFDDTLLDGDLSLALLADMEAADPQGQRAHYEAACARDVRSGYAELVETLLVGRSADEVRDHVRAVLDRGLADGSLRFRPALTELIDTMRHHGWDIWVVTASPAVVIDVAAERLGIGRDRVLGMWCREEDARFVAPTQEPITYRRGKVEALARAGCARPTFAAGDAPTDLEMLEGAQYGLVIDRGDPTLREAAHQRGWWVQHGL